MHIVHKGVQFPFIVHQAFTFLVYAQLAPGCIPHDPKFRAAYCDPVERPRGSLQNRENDVADAEIRNLL